MGTLCCTGLGALATAVITAPMIAQATPHAGKSYLVFVASESVDLVSLIRYGPRGATIEHTTSLRLNPGDDFRPRGIAIAPGRRAYYVTTTNGFPNGELLGVAIASDSSSREAQPPDTIRGREPLGLLPGALQVAAGNTYGWVTNLGSADRGQPGSVSVVYLDEMVESARIATCKEARGSRLSADGSKHYSVCTADGVLVEIDTRAMKIARRLMLGPSCAPTWVEPAADGSLLYVACSHSNDVAVVDAARWEITRRIPFRDGVTRITLTHDGKVLAGISERTQSILLVDAATGIELHRVSTRLSAPTISDLLRTSPDAWMLVLPVALRPGSRTPTSLVPSDDDRFLFATVARDGAAGGSLEVIDVAAGKVVASVDIGRGPVAVDFWKSQ